MGTGRFSLSHRQDAADPQNLADVQGRSFQLWVTSDLSGSWQQLPLTDALSQDVTAPGYEVLVLCCLCSVPLTMYLLTHHPSYQSGILLIPALVLGSVDYILNLIFL